MKTTTNKKVEGWNIYAPTSESVKVADWLRENDLEDDANNIKQGTTFSDFARCITEQGPRLIRVDTEKCEALTVNGYMDSFLRDVIFDAWRAIEKK